MSSADDVVIGEAVALELRPARVPSRALAFALDVVVLFVLLLLLLVAIVLAGDTFDGALGAAVGIGVFVGVGVGWPTLWETLSRGRTPGKFALGLRVVRDDGGPIGVRHALTRALAGLIVDFGVFSAFTGFIGVVVSASNERSKRVGDLLAGTIVVRERVPRSTATAVDAPPVVHPQLVGWASGLELAALPDDLALAVRQFLGRASRFEPEARRSLGERLASEVAGRVAPAPPSGVPAETYLAAVLGERHRREVARHGRAAPPRTAVGPGWAPPPGGPGGWNPSGASSPPGPAGPSGPSGPPPEPATTPPAATPGFAPPG